MEGHNQNKETEKPNAATSGKESKLNTEPLKTKEKAGKPTKDQKVPESLEEETKAKVGKKLDKDPIQKDLKSSKEDAKKPVEEVKTKTRNNQPTFPPKMKELSYKGVVDELRDAFNSGRTKNIEWRLNQLRGLISMYEENEELFAEALQKDLHKPKYESISNELDMLKNEIRGYLRNLKSWVQPQKVELAVASVMDETIRVPEPYGVALVIGAWNYPLNLTLMPVSGAIAAGNCVLIKPSEIAVHSANLIEKLVPKYVDQDCIKVVNGGVPETTAVLKERFDYIFYTGSTTVGKIVGRAANEYLTPCTLELGGKSPAYIAADQPDAVLDVIAKRLLWGKALNVGQTCIAPDYILCTKETEKRLLKRFEPLMEEWYGENLQKSKDYGRIVTERHFKRLVGLLQASKGKIVMGGQYDKDDLFMSVTVLTDIKEDDALMQEEIFGPIFPIVNVRSTGDAIKLINKREKPLTLYVFTESDEDKRLFMTETTSGGLTFNDTLFQLLIESLPFGGVGNSGMGSYHGKATFDTFSHMKSIMVKDFRWLGETMGSIRYPPYNKTKLAILQMLMYNREIHSWPTVMYLMSIFMNILAFLAEVLVNFYNNIMKRD